MSEEQIHFPPIAQLLLNHDETLWQIVQAVAETDVTFYNDVSGDSLCHFCDGRLSQTANWVKGEEFTHESDCVVTKARVLIRQRALHPRVELKIHDASDELSVVNAVLHWKELMGKKDGEP